MEGDDSAATSDTMEPQMPNETAAPDASEAPADQRALGAVANRASKGSAVAARDNVMATTKSA